MPAFARTPRAAFHPALTDAIDSLAAGRGVVLIDERRNAADVVGAAGDASADIINFMAREACGLICLALPAARVDQLELRPMAAIWGQPCKPFTVSVDARVGITTGISAAERAHTIRIAVAQGTQPEDLVVPGHVFPLRAHPGGLSAVAGRVEASLALAALAGRGEGAVLCEILDGVGELADAETAFRFARRHGVPALKIGAVVAASTGVGLGRFDADVGVEAPLGG